MKKKLSELKTNYSLWGFYYHNFSKKSVTQITLSVFILHFYQPHHQRAPEASFVAFPWELKTQDSIRFATTHQSVYLHLFYPWQRMNPARFV